MKLADLDRIPLVSEELTSELYGDISDPEMLEMQKEIWAGITRDLPKEIQQIQALAKAGGEDYRKLLHRVAGYVGSGGLGRCCEALRALEYNKLSENEEAELLASLLRLSEESQKEMLARYPHLAVTQ